MRPGYLYSLCRFRAYRPQGQKLDIPENPIAFKVIFGPYYGRKSVSQKSRLHVSPAAAAFIIIVFEAEAIKRKQRGRLRHVCLNH